MRCTTVISVSRILNTAHIVYAYYNTCQVLAIEPIEAKSRTIKIKPSFIISSVCALKHRIVCGTTDGCIVIYDNSSTKLVCCKKVSQYKILCCSSTDETNFTYLTLKGRLKTISFHELRVKTPRARNRYLLIASVLSFIFVWGYYFIQYYI